MKNNSYHVVGEILILEVFMEPTPAHLSATIFQTATQKLSLTILQITRKLMSENVSRLHLNKCRLFSSYFSN
jgi:hypothetical protein